MAGTYECRVVATQCTISAISGTDSSAASESGRYRHSDCAWECEELRPILLFVLVHVSRIGCRQHDEKGCQAIGHRFHVPLALAGPGGIERMHKIRMDVQHDARFKLSIATADA